MKPNVVVVIPIYKPFATLTATEQLSLHQAAAILRGYDFVFVGHVGIESAPYEQALGPSTTGRTTYFSPHYFTGLVGYSDLLLSLDFYDAFAAYEYMLVCQLDVFLFADRLAYFTQKGYDYIGPPWFEGYDQATAASSILGVGNGGFSLRKVQSYRSILSALALFGPRRGSLRAWRAAVQHLPSVLRVAKHEYQRRTRAYQPVLPWHIKVYEDIYWAQVIPPFFPWFTLGTVADATAFGFEVNPRVLYELNQRQLPMGTHAWEKHDPEFWQQFISEAASRLEPA